MSYLVEMGMPLGEVPSDLQNQIDLLLEKLDDSPDLIDPDLSLNGKKELLTIEAEIYAPDPDQATIIMIKAVTDAFARLDGVNHRKPSSNREFRTHELVDA